MEVINNISIEFSLAELLKALNFKGSFENEIALLLEESRSLIEAKAVYAYLKVIGIKNDEIHLDSGNTLNGKILADMLQREQTIAPYVVTIGSKLEEKASEECRNSVFRSWVLDKIGNYAVGKATIQIKSIVEKKLGNSVSSFGPGRGGGKLFGIEQQKTLFEILSPQKNIGVILTSSYFMVPIKSVSGIFAVTKREYVACQYCTREGCDYRVKPFGGKYRNYKCDREKE